MQPRTTNFAFALFVFIASAILSCTGTTPQNDEGWEIHDTEALPNKLAFFRCGNDSPRIAVLSSANASLQIFSLNPLKPNGTIRLNDGEDLATNPFDLVSTPEGEAYVSLFASNSIIKLDLCSQQIEERWNPLDVDTLETFWDRPPRSPQGIELTSHGLAVVYSGFIESINNGNSSRYEAPHLVLLDKDNLSFKASAELPCENAQHVTSLQEPNFGEDSFFVSCSGRFELETEWNLASNSNLLRIDGESLAPVTTLATSNVFAYGPLVISNGMLFTGDLLSNRVSTLALNSPDETVLTLANLDATNTQSGHRNESRKDATFALTLCTSSDERSPSPLGASFLSNKVYRLETDTGAFHLHTLPFDLPPARGVQDIACITYDDTQHYAYLLSLSSEIMVTKLEGESP